MLEKGKYIEEASTQDTFWIAPCKMDRSQICPAFRCKDFMQDVMFAKTVKKDLCIYNFKTNFKENIHYIALSHPTLKLEPANFKRFLSEFRKKSCSFDSYDIENNIIYFNVTLSIHSITPIFLSLFCLLIRIMNFYDSKQENIVTFCENIEEIAEIEKYIVASDIKYLKMIKEFLPDLLTNIDILDNGAWRWNTWNIKNTTELHHRSGIVSFCNRFKIIKDKESNFFNRNMRVRNSWGLHDSKKVLLSGHSCKDVTQQYIHDLPSKKGLSLSYLQEQIKLDTKWDNIKRFFEAKDHAIRVEPKITGPFLSIDLDPISKDPILVSLFGTFMRICAFYDKKYNSVKEFILDLKNIQEKEKYLKQFDVAKLTTSISKKYKMNEVVHQYLEGELKKCTWKEAGEFIFKLQGTSSIPTYGYVKHAEYLNKHV